MTIPSGFHHKTGKEAMLASLNDYLVANIDGGQVGGAPLGAGKTFFWEFDMPIAPQNFPSISTAEIGLFNQGNFAMGDLLEIDSTGKAIKGTRNQTLIEINCWDDLNRDAAATKNIRNLRDKVVFVLTNAGKFSETTGTVILPKIDLKAIDEGGQPVVGTIRIDTSANSINERFLVDPVSQQLRRIKLLVRVFWFELQEDL